MVSEIVLKNEDWVVDLNTMGASMTRLFPRILGRSIIRDSPRDLPSGRMSGAYPVPTLFGRHAGNVVLLGGKSHRIPTEREYALHGLEVDHEYAVEEVSDTSASFSLSLTDKLDYPFDSQVSVAYILNGPVLKIQIRVRSHSLAPAMAVWHPFFQRYLNSTGGEGDHLRLETEVMEILRFEGTTPLPIREAEPVLPHEEFRRSRILVNPYDNSMSWSGNAILHWPSRLRLLMRSNARWLHLFTGKDRSVGVEPAAGPANGLWLAEQFQQPRYASVATAEAEQVLDTELEVLNFS